MSGEEILGLIGNVDFTKRITDEKPNRLYGDDKKIEQLSRQGKLTKIEGAFLLRWGGQLTNAPSNGVLSDLLRQAKGDHELVIACIGQGSIALKYQTPVSAANLVMKILKDRMPDPAVEEARQRSTMLGDNAKECGHFVNSCYKSKTTFQPYMGFEEHNEICLELFSFMEKKDVLENAILELRDIGTKAPDVLNKLKERFL